MTTTTQEVKGWTPEQEAKIAEFMEKEGLSRLAAIRKMVNGAKVREKHELGSNPVKVTEVKPKAAKAAKAPKAKPAAKKAAKPKEAGDCHLSDAVKEKVTQAVRKLIGAKAAVEGIVRSSLNPKYGQYIWYGLDNGKVVKVLGFGSDEIVASYMPEDSWAFKAWKRIQAARLRREEKAAKAAAK